MSCRRKRKRIVGMIDRLSFGFHNPNHAAAFACALLPLCFGWRWAAWVWRSLADGVNQVLVRKIVV